MQPAGDRAVVGGSIWIVENDFDENLKVQSVKITRITAKRVYVSGRFEWSTVVSGGWRGSEGWVSADQHVAFSKAEAVADFIARQQHTIEEAEREVATARKTITSARKLLK